MQMHLEQVSMHEDRERRLALNCWCAGLGRELVSFSPVRIVLSAVGASLVGGYAPLQRERERLNDLLPTAVSIPQFGSKSSFFW